MPTTPTPTKDEAQIHERLNAWTQALHAQDLDALMALYAPDVMTFDLMPWLEIRTLDIREWRAGDPVCVTEQLVFELVGALRVVERNKVRDFGEIPLRPS